MELSEVDINTFELTLKKMKQELVLVRKERENLQIELTEKSIHKTEVECTLKVNRDLRNSLQRKLNMKQASYANLEKRLIEADIKNKSLKSKLNILASQNDKFKHMLLTVTSNNNESAYENSTLKKQHEDYKAFIKKLNVKKQAMQESITEMKVLLFSLKAKNDLLLRESDKIPEIKLSQEIDKLKCCISKVVEEKQLLKREYCCYKEMNEQLESCLEVDTEFDRAMYFNKKVDSDFEESKLMIDNLTTQNKMLYDSKLHN